MLVAPHASEPYDMELTLNVNVDEVQVGVIVTLLMMKLTVEFHAKLPVETRVRVVEGRPVTTIELTSGASLLTTIVYVPSWSDMMWNVLPLPCATVSQLE